MACGGCGYRAGQMQRAYDAWARRRDMQAARGHMGNVIRSGAADAQRALSSAAQLAQRAAPKWPTRPPRA